MSWSILHNSSSNLFTMILRSEMGKKSPYSQRIYSLSILLIVLTTFKHGDCAVPTVVPVNGASQIAVIPNSFTISFTITPPVLASDITWSLSGIDITDTPGLFRQLSNDRLSLTINPVTSQDQGVFRLEASNSDGVGSGTVSLSIQSEPIFQDRPENVKIHERLNTTFKCFATGVPTVEINWFFEGSKIIPEGGNKYFIGPFGDDNYGSLTIYDLEFADAGTYTCEANNTHGVDSTTATLEVQVFPVIVVQPVSANITAGSIDTITCTARGFPFNDIYWQKNGQNITDINEIASYLQSVSEPNNVDLTVVGTLTITGPVLSTEGNFSCVAKNHLVTFEEAFSNEVEIFVQYPPSTDAVAMVTVNQTDPTSFSCSSFGIPPPTITWYSSHAPNTPIITSGVITVEYSSYVNDSGLQIQTSMLSISQTNRSLHEGNYTCLATNGIENFIGTSELGITELIVQVPPSLLASEGSSLLGVVTNSLTLAVVIDNASPSVRSNNIVWEYRNLASSETQVVTADSRYSFSGDRTSLTISYLMHEDEGYYTVTATNEAGYDTLELTLNIEAAPNITIFPTNIDVLMNSNASLTCGATSEPTHTVQWLKGEEEIGNDGVKYTISQVDGEEERERVSILTILFADMNDTDGYTCNVSNIHGSQSHTANVEVQVPPVLLNPRDNTTDTIIGIFSEATNISCQFFGSPIPEILWLKDLQPLDMSDPDVSVITSIDGFTHTSTLIFSELNFFDDGNYVCQGRNTLFDLQTTNSSDISLVINRSPYLTTTSGLTVVVNQSQSLNITCTFLARPLPSIVWTSQKSPSFPPTTLEDNDKYNIIESSLIQIDGVSRLTTSVLEIIDLGSSDSLDYTCTATNTPRGPSTPSESSNGVQSVIVQTSPIVNRVSNEVEIGVKGNNITLSFDITRDVPSVIPDEGINWYLIRSNSDPILITQGVRHEFDNNRTSLTITTLNLDDQGTYSLNASNIIGSDFDIIFLDVQRSPVITNNSGVVKQVLGRDALLECTAVSEPVHISRWLFEGEEIFNSDKYLIQGNGTTSSNLTIYNVSRSDEGSYTCRVDNAHGIDEESAQLLVQVPPSIFQDPANVNVLVTNTVSLVCCASGIPVPSISWFKESQRVTNTSRITVYQEESCGTLTITNATLSDTASYQCEANNNLAEEQSEMSNIADILVHYPPEVYPLDQTSFTRNESDEFIIECSAFGVPLPLLYWIPSPLKETLSTPQNQLLSAQDVVATLASAASFNSSRLLNAKSQCAVDDGSGSGQQFNNTDACSYVTESDNDCFIAGSICSVPCVVDVTTYSDRFDSLGRSIAVSRLRICSLLKSDELSYTCVGVNDISNVIDTAEGAYANLVIQVLPEVIAFEESDPVTAFRDRNVTLDFMINRAFPDVAPEDITWTFLPERQNGTDIKTIDSSDAHYDFSEDRRSMRIISLTTDDAGIYTLTAKNPAGIVSGNITLDVQALPDIENLSPPMKVKNNDTIMLDCFADGSPIQNVMWTLTDEAQGSMLYSINFTIDDHDKRIGHQDFVPLVDGISLDLKDKFSIAPPDLSVSTELYGQLTIRDITPFEAGVYNCTLNNKFGTMSDLVPVLVQLDPSIAQAPYPITCTVGKSCEMSCLVEGVPSPLVSFWKGNTSITNSNGIELVETISNYTHKGLSLRTSNTELSIFGTYSCRGTNFLVSNESVNSNEAMLTVHSPATIIHPIIDTIGNETYGASFTCSVAGIPEPNVTWYRFVSGNETMIVMDGDKYSVSSNAMIGEYELVTVTSQLMISNLEVSDESIYICRGINNVENVIGAVDDSSATLTVHVPPTVELLMPSEVIIVNGSETTISFNITRAFPPVELSDIQWTFNHIGNTEETEVITLDPRCVLEASNCSNERYSRYNFSSDLLTLTIYSARVADYGRFSLTASNPAGSNTTQFRLIIHVPAMLLYTSGVVRRLNESDELMLNCTADGIPIPVIFWSFQSSSIDVSLRPRTSQEIQRSPGFRTSIATVPENYAYTSTLRIIDVLKNTDEGEFTCGADNGVGGRQLLDQPYDIFINRVVENFCASEPCEHGGKCTNGANTFQCECGRFEGRNYGGPTCGSEIFAEIPPKITTHPQNNFVRLFDTVELSCDATGQPDPTIDWYKNGVNLNFRGNVFTIKEVTLNDRGNYSCTAKNNFGKITSYNAIVNIEDIIQYTANLTVKFSQITGNNLTAAANGIIQNINLLALGRTVDSGDTFFAINIQGVPINNTKNLTIPILLTIRINSSVSNEMLRQNVETAVLDFGYALQISDNAGVVLFDRCEAENTIIPSPDGNRQLDFVLSWPQTLIGATTTLLCPCNLTLGSSTLTATRTCRGNFEAGADWSLPADSNCDFTVLARELCRLANLNSDEEILNSLIPVTSDVNALGSVELTITTALLERTEAGASGNDSLTNSAADSFDNCLKANRSSQLDGQRTSRSQTRAQQVLSNLTNSLSITRSNKTSVSADVPIAIVRDTFAISINELQNPSNLNLETSSILPNGLNVSVQANFSELFNQSSSQESSAYSFSAFANDGLFLARNNPTVIATVIDLTVRNREVSDLMQPVNFTFNVQSNLPMDNSIMRCVFWDQTLDDGFGDWSSSGCTSTPDPLNPESIICSCDHLTSFSVLLDVRAEQTPPPGEDLAFETLTYIGISVSVVCLLLTIFTYLYSPKLRKSEANQLLVNLCFALLGLYLTFFLAAQGSKITTFVCVVVGALLHYFLLVVFFVMAAEAIDLFIKLVIVLGSTIQNYFKKAVIIAWILPLFIVPFTVSPHYQSYVNEHYCGATGPALYVGVLVPFFVVYIFNNTIFFIIMFSLLKKSGSKNFGDAKKKNRKQETKQHCRVAFTISILFGLGWGFGLLASQAIGVQAIRVIFNTLFTVFIAFQGFFIFLLYIVLSPNAKKEWKRWILRKEDKGVGTSSVGGSSSRGTRSTSVKRTSAASYQKYNKKRGGTLYHNIYSSQAKTASSGFGSTVFDSADMGLVEELNLNQENDKTFENPLDTYEDTFSMASDTQSINEAAASAFPNPKPALSQDVDNFEASLTVEDDEEGNVNCTTHVNPFLETKGKQFSVDGDELDLLSQENNSNGTRIFSFDMSQTYSSQGLESEATFSEDKDLIKPPEY